MSQESLLPDQSSYGNGTLCEFCDGFFRRPTFREAVIRQDYSNIESLADRCIICAIIFNAASRPINPPINKWSSLQYSWFTLSWRINALNLVLSVTSGGRESLLDTSISFYPLNEAHKQFNMAYVGSNGKPIDTWPLIENWMQSCLHDHQACNQPVGPAGWHPTRLLDLDPSGLPGRIRLQEGDEIPQGVRYTTLSHCWGSVQPVTLTSENETEMKTGILLETFPKTFRDAIAITIRLGIRYLWIDSLCIIQDSREDWAKESGLMCSVYSNSYCSISATAAFNSSEGCFTGNPKQIKNVGRPFRVHIAWDDWNGDYCASRVNNIWNELEDAPLNTRAWVHQERLLAPRIIHFGLSELVWECNESRMAELSPPGLSVPTENIRDFTKQECASLWFPSGNKISLESKHVLPKWSQIWSKYAKSRLTQETDRLVALAGIVDRIKPVLDDEFLAGLWRRNLELQLCWFSFGPSSKRQDTFIAPSWSWAALQGRYLMQDSLSLKDEKITLLEVIDAQVSSVQDGPKYTVTGGFVKARCYLIPATRIHGESAKILVSSPTGHSVQMKADFHLDTEADYSLPHIWCVPILAAGILEFPETDGGMINGLLLEKLEDQSNSSKLFRRCGYFRLDDLWTGHNIRVFWHAASYFERGEPSSECSDGIWKISDEWLASDSSIENHLSLYTRKDGVGQQVITII